MRQAKHLVKQGREHGEAVQELVPEVQHHLLDLREQAEALIHRIEYAYEQAQPAIEEGKRSAHHGAAAVSLASEIPSSPPTGRRRSIWVLLLVLTAAAFVARKYWGQTGTSERGAPGAS